MQLQITSDAAYPNVTVQYVFDGAAGSATVIVSLVPLLRAIPVPTLTQLETYLSEYGYSHAAGVTAVAPPTAPAGLTAVLNTPFTAAAAATVTAAYALLGIQ